MIINFKPGSDPEDVEVVLAKVRELGYTKLHESGGAERLVVGIAQDVVNGDREAIREFIRYECVDDLVDISKGFKTLALHANPKIEVKDKISISKGELTMIGGPCAVESLEQIMECARSVSEIGGKIMRGGCYKPRSNPESWQGLGKKGLKMLREAADKYGLAVITEVTDTDKVGIVAEYSDILQIGTVNIRSHSLIRKASKTGKPVMIKTGYASNEDEILSSVQYVIKEGNSNVMLCERGIRYGVRTWSRNILDLDFVAKVVKMYPNLIVFADPSHGSGDRNIVPELSLAAVMAGADGLLIEAHPNPEEAKVDGYQSLRYTGKGSFGELFANAYKVFEVRKQIMNGK